MKAIFLDRDGTINVGTPTYDRVDTVDKVVILPKVIEALQLLSETDYEIFLVTNQAGIGEGLINDTQFETINQKFLEIIRPSQIRIVDTYVCPHTEKDLCQCRKPKPGLLLSAAKEHGIDLTQSWMIGDRKTDVQAGIAAGTKTILVKSGNPLAEAPEATYTADSLLDAVNYILEH